MSNKKTTQIISEIGLFSAIGFILDEFQGLFFKGIFINGGSIGIAMIAVLIISYRRGIIAGALTGLIIGLLDIASSAYIIHPAQLFLDYLFPYAFVALSGIFRKKYINNNHQVLYLVLGTIAGGIAKLTSHYLSGIIFWANPKYFAWNLSWMSSYAYSFLYNFAFIGPSIILCLLLILIINKKGGQILIAKDEQQSSSITTPNIIDKTISVFSIICGLGLFISFLIIYIKSYQGYSEASTVDYSFNKDSMLIWIIGLMLFVIGTYGLISIIKKYYIRGLTFGSLIFVGGFSLIYSIVALIKASRKSALVTNYVIWLSVSIVFILLIVTIILLLKKQQKQ